MREDRASAVRDALERFVNEHRQFLIVGASPYYVQFAGVYEELEPGAEPIDRYVEWGLYAEAVSDTFLEADRHLGNAGAARLTNLGWNPPANEDRPNWHREILLNREFGLEGVARLVVDTFAEGFRAGEAFTFELGPGAFNAQVEKDRWRTT